MAAADNLIADEAIEFRSRKHWAAPIRASWIAFLLLIGFVVIRLIAPTGDGFVGAIGDLLRIVSLVLLIAGVVSILYNIVAWRTAEFVVTNLRVVREEGLLSRKSSASLISSISDVKSRVGPVGKALGYGDLLIMGQSGGAGSDRFTTITEPEAFRNAIMTRKMTDNSRPGTVATQEAAAVAATAAAPPPESTPAPVAAPAPADPAVALNSLADLRDRGVITAEEFEAKKAEILARM
jgi:uncharacterized membrane protein YdbT with pleckstrin-like domain